MGKGTQDQFLMQFPLKQINKYREPFASQLRALCLISERAKIFQRDAEKTKKMACPLQPLEFQGKEYRHKLGSEDRPLLKKKAIFILEFKTTGTFSSGLNFL